MGNSKKQTCNNKDNSQTKTNKKARKHKIHKQTSNMGGTNTT